MSVRLTLPPTKSIAMIGLMGAGKTAIGRRLARRIDLPFVDADDEIERAAGCSISDIFEIYGEVAFRDVERRVIDRLLEDRPISVISTGGGAFMDPDTRKAIAGGAISVWLEADLDVLVERTSRRTHRPLLRDGDPATILKGLMDQRYPVYAEAALTVKSENCPVERTVDRVITALNGYLVDQVEAAGS
ncbi:MAG: shikimate kinase [Pseudomonadota bacterium]